MKKGWIALDIDGTITDKVSSVPNEVTNYLRALHLDGWEILLSTGRSYTFALPSVREFDFPFYFSIQNGTAVLEMPSMKTMFTDYVSLDLVDIVHQQMDDVEGVVVVYSGHKQDDRCYWHADKMKHDYQKDYLERLMKIQKQEGFAIDDFSTLGFEEVSLIKCVGPYEKLLEIGQNILEKKHCSYSLLRDPFDPRFHILMLTKLDVDKGSALKKLIDHKGSGKRIIVGGNDGNDLSLFREGNWKIAMKDSPKELLDSADYIAPPVEEMGIIKALQYATERR